LPDEKKIGWMFYIEYWYDI